MHEADRFKLLFGPYRMPRCRVGRFLSCTFRGEVRVVGISDARIPWPQTRVGGTLHGRQGGVLTLIICGDLERAIRTESNQAVAYWFGITKHTVSQWRKRLNVGQLTEGTLRLKRDVFAETLDNGAREKLLASLHRPERGKKIGASRRGKKRPPETVERMRQARLGMGHTADAREKMRQSQLARYARLGRWTEEADAQLGTMSDCELAALLGLNSSSVRKRRIKLGVPAYRPGARP